MTTAGEATKLLLTDRPIVGRSFSDILVELEGAVRTHQPIINTLPCGLALIDETVGGLIRGEFAGPVAAPGVGKSTLADQLVVNTLLANPGTRGVIFALETATAVRAARLVANRCIKKNDNSALVGVAPIRALLRGELRDAGTANALQAIDELRALLGTRLRYVDSVTSDSDISRIIAEERPDVLLIDHLGMVLSESQASSETMRMDESLAQIVAAIRSANCAGIRALNTQV